MNLHKEEQGSITVVALLILVVLTVLGVTLTRTTTLDLRIGTNETIRKQNFYVSEGGVFREAAEVGEGNYVVTNIYEVRRLAKRLGANEGLTDADWDLNDEFWVRGNIQGGSVLPGAAHEVQGSSYDFALDYIGFHLPPKGYSADQFSRYDFDIRADRNNVNVYGRFYRIGPKAK